MRPLLYCYGIDRGNHIKSYIDKKGFSVKEEISIAIQIANGIECAHNNQIVHRDIKPSEYYDFKRRKSR